MVVSLNSADISSSSSSSYKVSYDILEVKMSILNHRSGSGGTAADSYDHGSGTNTSGPISAPGMSTSNNIYLSIDLSTELVSRLKNLSTHDIEQLRQIGVLSVQFDNDSYRVNIPPLEPTPTLSTQLSSSVLQSNAAVGSSYDLAATSNTIRTQDFARMDIYQQRGSNLGNETKKRNRKTISELTSGAIYATNSECSNDNELSNGPTSSNTNTRKAGGSRGPTKRGSSRDMSNGLMSGGSTTSSSPYILTSMIVDQSPYAAAPLNSQFQYMKQFTMPSPILSNILTDSSVMNDNHTAREKLMYMDGYKHIYQMRQELASQVGLTGEQTGSQIVGQPPIKKQRKTQQNKDSDKPRGRRGARPQNKAELVESTSNVQQSSQSQQQAAYFYQTQSSQMLNNSGNYMLNNGSTATQESIKVGGGGVATNHLPNNESMMIDSQQQIQQPPAVMFHSS